MSDIKESFYNKLDEMRSETLKSYKEKAEKDKENATFIKGLTHFDSSVHQNVKDYWRHREVKREKGIERAKKKLNEILERT